MLPFTPEAFQLKQTTKYFFHGRFALTFALKDVKNRLLACWHICWQWWVMSH
jgi:hypothetical protein